MTDNDPKVPERRRPKWREFRRAYPGFTFTMTLCVIALLALNGYALYKRNGYAKETARLREDMTAAERKRADMIVEDEKNRVAIALELAKRQARVDKQLHLSVATDSGRMYLEREGAVLREMLIDVGPEQRVKKIAGAPADSVPIAVPRGERTIISFTNGDTPTIELDGG